MTAEPDRPARLQARLAPLVRVSVSNVLIDLAVTNALVLLMGSLGSASLLVASVVACSAATVRSFLLSRHPPFSDANEPRPSGQVAAFLVLAAVAMAANTSVFLWALKYLPERLGIGGMPAVNMAKLLGAAVALVVSFPGYGLTAFRAASVRAFRRRFVFDFGHTTSLARQTAWLLLVAIATRLGYLCLTTAVAGDAVNYAGVAMRLAEGAFDKADSFWSSSYCYWQALFHMAGASPVAGAILASLVPGVLLVVLVAWVARSLYGARAAWLAGLLCAFHPRLIEYSCNGYAESAYIFAFACGIAFLVRVVQRGTYAAAVGWGVGFGAYATIRNEALLAFLLSLPLAFLVRHTGLCSTESRSPTRPGGRATGWARIFMLQAASASAFAAVIVAYGLLSQMTLGTCGMFQKASNLDKAFSEQLDMRQAARETYGAQGALLRERTPRPARSGRVSVLLRRFPRNVLYSVERMPGILLSPMVLFAFVLPAFAANRGRVRGDEVPLALMLAFPLLFYPLIQVEPRLFFATLVPIHIFGAAGLWAFCAYMDSDVPRRLAYPLIAGVVVLLMAVASVWRGVDVERRFRPHRQLAKWLSEHTAEGDAITGCGYGHITTTAFHAGRVGIPRLWTSEPGALRGFAVARGCRWLVIYERFLRDANPELLPVLESGVPGFRRVLEVRDARGHRSQVYVLAHGAP